MNVFLKLFRKLDWWLIGSVMILSLIGLSAIYSVDLSKGQDLIYIPKQLIALVIGLFFLFISANLQVSFYENSAKFFYIFSIILLIAVLFFGENIRGTTGWFKIFGFSFQPAEFAKLALVIFLAWRIERQARRFEKWQFVLVLFVLSFLPFVLILLQPDLGSGLIFMGVWFMFLLAVGVKKKYLAVIVLSGIFVFLSAWFLLFQDYQKNRILTFLNPEADPLGSGYNVTQSIIAIGSGQISGRGLGFGSQSQLHFLPEAQTDFIFAVIGEEMGFFGAGLALILYIIMIWRLFDIAQCSKNDFSAYLVLGISFIFFFQIIINIGATVGILPVTGVTLPFLSYGGSSMIINLFLIGIAESVAKTV
ncbi:MAG: rod shape-determining protein RodA [Patescibacteria group bacterium]